MLLTHISLPYRIKTKITKIEKGTRYYCTTNEDYQSVALSEEVDIPGFGRLLPK